MHGIRSGLTALVLSGLLVAAPTPPAEAGKDPSADTPPEHWARVVSERYFRAVRHHNGSGVCRRLTTQGKRDLVAETPRRSCVEVARGLPAGLGRFPIVDVRIEDGRAYATVGDAAISDSGNDAIELVHTARGWKVDTI